MPKARANGPGVAVGVEVGVTVGEGDGVAVGVDVEVDVGVGDGVSLGRGLSATSGTRVGNVGVLVGRAASAPWSGVGKARDAQPARTTRMSAGTSQKQARQKAPLCQPRAQRGDLDMAQL